MVNVEPGIGIIVASLATLRPLFGRFLDHARNSIVKMSSSRSSVRMSNPTSTFRFSRTWRDEPSPSLSGSNTWDSRDSRRSTVVSEARNSAARSEDKVHTQDFADLAVAPRYNTVSVPVRAGTLLETGSIRGLVDFADVDFGPTDRLPQPLQQQPEFAGIDFDRLNMDFADQELAPFDLEMGRTEAA